MGGPRNIAHAKKVSLEKHHKDKHVPRAGSSPSQRAKGVQTEKKVAPVAESTAPKAEVTPTQPTDPTQLEKSHVVLSKLKELEFHSRANIEKLAELSLTVEEELKQKAFAESIGAVYAAQDAFQSKILQINRRLRSRVHSSCRVLHCIGRNSSRFAKIFLPANHPPSPRLLRGRPAFAKAAAWQARIDAEKAAPSRRTPKRFPAAAGRQREILNRPLLISDLSVPPPSAGSA